MLPDLHWTSYAPLWLFCPVLVAVAASDLARMKIPNRLVAIGFVLFLVTLPFIDFHEAVARARDGAICFGLCLVLFAMGWLGGGDAKMLPVVFLFIPSPWVISYMFGFAASLMIGMILIWALRMMFGHPDSAWKSMQPGAAFPMGISMAMSGLSFAFWAIVTLI